MLDSSFSCFFYKLNMWFDIFDYYRFLQGQSRNIRYLDEFILELQNHDESLLSPMRNSASVYRRHEDDTSQTCTFLGEKGSESYEHTATNDQGRFSRHRKKGTSNVQEDSTIG